MKVLVVCSGNICRSPMAAEYLRHRAPANNLSHLVVASGGLLGIEGAPASPEAVQVMNEHGIDLGRHRSRGIRAADVRTSDVIIGMTLDHLELLGLRHPEGPGERHLLRAFERGAEPMSGAPGLDDPVGESIEVFREQFEIIRASMDHLLIHLKYRTR